MHLIALYPVLHNTIMYQVGEELPTDDAEMVKLWLENNIAEVKQEEDQVIDEVTKVEETQDQVEDKVNKAEESPKEPVKVEEKVDKKSTTSTKASQKRAEQRRTRK